jgi:hypothetical protein
MSGYKFMGNLDNIDPSKLFLIVIGILLLYSFIHLMIFKILFKKYVFIPYKNADEMEKEVDKLLDTYILIKTEDNKILEDEEFFKILFDSSKIDKLNEIFYSGIITRDLNGCLYQKVFIYNLYCYLREYMVFDEEKRTLFKKYCITNADNKPATFISLLNAGETKMIRKYHDELPFVNQIPDKHLDFFNTFNKETSKRIKELNMKIVNYTKTALPFFITIVYIIIIFILNYIVLYIILSFILSKPAENKFNPYMIMGAYYAKKYLYDKVIELLKKYKFLST